MRLSLSIVSQLRPCHGPTLSRTRPTIGLSMVSWLCTSWWAQITPHPAGCLLKEATFCLVYFCSVNSWTYNAMVFWEICALQAQLQELCPMDAVSIRLLAQITSLNRCAGCSSRFNLKFWVPTFSTFSQPDKCTSGQSRSTRDISKNSPTPTR